MQIASFRRNSQQFRMLPQVLPGDIFRLGSPAFGTIIDPVERQRHPAFPADPHILLAKAGFGPIGYYLQPEIVGGFLGKQRGGYHQKG